MTVDALDERSLLDRVAGGDRTAFETLYTLYYPRLFRFLLRYTGSLGHVEELINDVMLVVWRRASDFRGRSKVSTWVLGIAYRKGLKSLDRDRRRPRHDDIDEIELASVESPEHDLSRRQLRDRVLAALGRLPAEQRAVLELTYYHGCSYPEIAEILGCPHNTVKTRMFHARRKLRDLLPELERSAERRGGFDR
jgi:RNA polymerase sigma-70 factor (ECF subfamily)